MNTSIIDQEIKNVREELELIKLSPKLLNLVNIILKNPSETFGNCCKMANYAGTTAIIKTSKARKYLELSQKLQQLNLQKDAIVTKEDVITMLKNITLESGKDRIPALALIAKICGLEAPSKSEVDVKQVVINFEEDR